MNPYLKNTAAFLLLLNGIGAIYGGGHLVAHPDGSSLHIPLSVLRYSPFTDFLIPGIILLGVNGLLSLFVLATLILDIKYYPRLLMAQGTILIVWIAIQIAMLRGTHYLHFIFGAVGVLLILCGELIKPLNYQPRHK